MSNYDQLLLAQVHFGTEFQPTGARNLLCDAAKLREVLGHDGSLTTYHKYGAEMRGHFSGYVSSDANPDMRYVQVTYGFDTRPRQL